MDVTNGPLVAHPSDEHPIILAARLKGFPISKIEFFTNGNQHFEGMGQPHVHKDEFWSIQPYLDKLNAEQVVQEIERLGTCELWPKNQSFNVIPLVDIKSGLHFSGLVGDPKWFYWNRCLQKWEPTDEPQTEKDKLLNQGEQAFIAHVQQVYPPPISTPAHVGEANDEEIPMETDEADTLAGLISISSYDEPTPRMNSSPRTVAPATPIGSLQPETSVSSGSPDPRDLNKQLCKICLDNEFNTVFQPCKHLATCSECAAKVTECPICRQPILESLTVIIS